MFTVILLPGLLFALVAAIIIFAFIVPATRPVDPEPIYRELEVGEFVFSGDEIYDEKAGEWTTIGWQYVGYRMARRWKVRRFVQ